jgi:TRAP-type C4-dicarboxylate transport system substrate-binding protein
MLKRIVFFLVMAVWLFPSVGKPTDLEVIKLGTLATEDSAWGRELNRMNAELIKVSDNEVRFQIHFGRDDNDLAELLINKQMDAVSLTVPGLGRMVQEVYIFQLPMLFSSYEELDHVRGEITPDFSRKFNEKGYVLLGWGDLGFSYLFSKEPLRTQTDLQKTKLWVMDSDIVAQRFASAAGGEHVKLPIQNVLSKLARGEIQTVYGPTLGCIAMQWHTQVKYMTDLPLVAAIGATIMNKERFDKLSGRHQNLVKEICGKYHKQIIEIIRQQNQESFEVLKKQGIELISVPHQEKSKWKQIALQVRNSFVGQLYKRELLDRVEKLLNE